MIAKYDGTCFISGKTITAGESEIEQRSGKWCLVEFATREAFQAKFEATATQFPTHRKVLALMERGADRGYITVDLEMLEGLVARLTAQQKRAEVYHDADHSPEYPHRLCRKCQAAGWRD